MSLTNETLSPTQASDQKWKTYAVFSLWSTNIFSVGGFVYIASLFSTGLSIATLLLMSVLGAIGVAIFSSIIGKPCQANGIPSIVLTRLSFGIYGAKISGFIRMITDIVWYAIQTYFTTIGLQLIILSVIPAAKFLAQMEWAGLSALGWICLLSISLVQYLIFAKGIDAIRKYIAMCAPMLMLAVIILLGYIVWHNHGLITSLHLPSHSHTNNFNAHINIILLTLAYFAGPMLNYGDFARFIKSPNAMHKGNILGLVLSFAAYLILVFFIIAGVAVFISNYSNNPLTIIHKIHNHWLTLTAGILFTLSTFGMNLTTNYVTAAFNLSNLLPHKIEYKHAGQIISIISLLIFPWFYINNPTWMLYFVNIAGTFVAPTFGIIIADYYFVKKQQLDLKSLFSTSPKDKYYYQKGHNTAAFVALALSMIFSILCVILGKIMPALTVIDNWGWVIGLLSGGFIYILLMQFNRSSIDNHNK